MTIGDFIRMGNAPPSLRFLVIGGWAVGAHGHTRSTFDVDFLVCNNDRAACLRRLADLGLTKTSEFKTFAQFRQEKGDGFQLDFSAQKYEEIFLKYGTRELYGAFVQTLRH